jgi:hypothetical protein
MGAVVVAASSWDAPVRFVRSSRISPPLARVRVREHSRDAVVIEFESTFPVHGVAAQWDGMSLYGETAIAPAKSGRVTVRRRHVRWSSRRFLEMTETPGPVAMFVTLEGSTATSPESRRSKGSWSPTAAARFPRSTPSNARSRAHRCG